MKFQMLQQDKDAELAARMQQEAEEHARAEAAGVQRRAALAEWAERTVLNPSIDTLATMAERGDDISALYPEPSAALADVEQAVSVLEAEADARIGTRNDVYLRGMYRERLAPLHEQVREARDRVDACRAVALERIGSAVSRLVGEQVSRRSAVLTKALPHEQRIRQLEQLQSHFGVVSCSSRVLGIARWTTS